MTIYFSPSMDASWRQGFPKEKMNEENKQQLLDKYEVYFSPGGIIWHRERGLQNA